MQTGLDQGVTTLIELTRASRSASCRLWPDCAQANVLLALQPEQAISQRDLAGQLGYDPSNLTGLIDRLEERSSVQRRPAESDRRIKMVVLTDPGLPTRTDYWAQLTNDAGPLAHLASREVRTLRDLLGQALGGAVPARDDGAR
jgi:DNA-binding MarR family transcriptional regulator